MKHCPRCHKSFPDDLNFCLEHGTRLVALPDDDSTWVLSEPEPTIAAQGRHIAAGPTIAAPTQKRSSTWKVLSIVGVILAVCAYGALKIALSFRDHEEPAAQNDSTPTPFNLAPATTTASPSPSVVTNPSPSPESSAIVSTASPTPEPSEPKLLPGTYQMQVKLNNRPEDAFALRTMKMQFIFNTDGTYTIQGFITIAGTEVQDRLYREERGDYKLSDDLLTFSDRLARELDRENNVWKPWGVPSDGRLAKEKIRHISPTSFELALDGRWEIVNKL